MSDNKAITKYVFQLGDQAVALLGKMRAFLPIAKLTAEYNYADEPVPWEERESLPLRPIKEGTQWSLRRYGCGWFRLRGTVPQKGKGKHIVLLVDVGGEGCVRDETGEPIAGITDIAPVGKNFHLCKGKKIIEVCDCAEGGEEIDLWLEVGDNGEGEKRSVFKQARIAICNDAMKDFFYGYTTLALTKPYASYFGKERRTINAALTAAAIGQIKKDGEKVNRAFEKGCAVGTNPYSVYAVGHGHLDLAFMWPIRETKRKAIRTFINQLNLADRYSGYVYGASQPQQFVWVEETDPQLFRRIKQAVREGKIEPQGGMWVESDCNLPSGESLIRQAVYGQRYWKETFGESCTYCWLPDCFGFNANLPQILKKCGMDGFLTTKLSWNDTNYFTKHSFVWEGIDGSRVNVHMPPEDAYSGEALPINTVPAQKRYLEKEQVPLWASLFGMGDGGAGPSVGHLETMVRQQRIESLPKIKFAPMKEFFAEFGKYADKMEVYRGELYLERHRGTYTSQAQTKYNNRKAEIELHNTEFLRTVCDLPYPKEGLDKIWKEVLLYQFHDVLPGSSVHRVYEENGERYKAIFEELNRFQKEALDSLPQGESVLNRTGYRGKRYFYRNGQRYAAELQPYAFVPLLPVEDRDTLFVTDTLMENARWTLKFDGTGEIVSVTDKATGKEKLASYGNRYTVYTDTPKKYDAWDIDYEYLGAQKEILSAKECSFGRAEGCVYHTASYAFGGSTLTRNVILREDSPLIEIEAEVDWHETHKMLRAEFEPYEWADEAVFDIQMGNIRRKTTERDSYEKAQWEVCAHKWADVSDKTGGTSYFAEAKYGWRVKKGLVSLNLLRSPVDPDPMCDRGKHLIRYAFYPHTGDAFEAQTPRLAALYNNPPIICPCAPREAFVSSDCENIVIETVKRGENGGICLRVYEDSGKETMAKITCGQRMYGTETDMLENPVGTPDLTCVRFSPYEIKTILLDE